MWPWKVPKWLWFWAEVAVNTVSAKKLAQDKKLARFFTMLAKQEAQTY
jgi:hypothetical protein